MRAVLQRVTGATVHVDGRLVSRIGPGIVALIGIGVDDSADEIAPLTKKILTTRLWNEGVKAESIDVPSQYRAEPASDGQEPTGQPSGSKAAQTPSSNEEPVSRSEQMWAGKPWNRNVKDIEGEILCISQFTLHARLSKGPKPDFHRSMAGTEARVLYEQLLDSIRRQYAVERVKDGAFGEMMQCSLTNDGPVTILVDTSEKK